MWGGCRQGITFGVIRLLTLIKWLYTQFFVAQPWDCFRVPLLGYGLASE